MTEAAAETGRHTAVPIAVDLDETLTKSNNLHDAVATALLRSPGQILALLSAAMHGRLALKLKLAEIGAYRAETVPLRHDFVSYLKDQKARGRSLHLVTASPQPVADAIASRVGIFSSVAGSTDAVNLKGAAKARYLQERFPEGFAYAGNDDADIEVWRRAKSAITVAAAPSTERAIALLGVPVEHSQPRPKTALRSWIRMLRVRQWSKNLLIFVPLMLGHRYDDPGAILQVFLGFLCMCFVASATYIVNDLSDLDSDRRHATKHSRPLAAGDVSVGTGVTTALVLGAVGLAGALALSGWFALAMVGYVVLTLTYSLRLKEVALLDVFVLGLLYTLRIMMGIVLLDAPATPWLLVFSLFFFYALAMAKRHVEIVRARYRGETGRIRGRGYEVADEPLTLALGLTANGIAVVLLFLYVANDAYSLGSYRSPEWLWAISPLVFQWSSRIWIKSHRGKLDDDPINFALRDKPSLFLGALVAICFVLALR